MTVRGDATADVSAAAAIARAARELDATVVKATHARSGLGQAFLGSVAMDVVHQALHSVLVVLHHPAEVLDNK